MSTNLNLQIIHLRNKKKWSQIELATKLGVSKSTMSKIEAGTRKVSVEELKILGDIFQVSADYLVGLSVIPNTFHKISDFDMQNLIYLYSELFYGTKGEITEEDIQLIKDIIEVYFLRKFQK